MSDFHILFSLSIVSFSLCLCLCLCFSLYKTLHKRTQKREQTQKDEVLDKPYNKNDPHSLLLEILPSDSEEKWAGLCCDDQGLIGSGHDEKENLWSGDNNCGDQFQRKKKKRKAKKKRLDLNGKEEGKFEDSGNWVNPELICLYPFTSTSSATQRKIKQQYDQLVKYHEKKRLTLVQVGEFANCLSEARNELQQKSEVIKRKFKLTKALLFKADRSSFDRLRQQIYKLEMEQKRLEEDAFVYNWLQQQLKLSQAYKKMLEISACMEIEAKSGEPIESTDTEFSEISFEELLAQEKKDSFWQKKGKSRLSST